MSARAISAAEDSAFLQALGTRLRMLRARRGMTRRMLAAQSGVSERYISAMEGGTGNGSVLLLRSMARALNVPLRVLLEDDAEPDGLSRHRQPSFRQRIALIGLRGAGKSTLGARLADLRGVPFIELDRLIEAEAGMGLGEVMELHGQTGLRRLERRCLERIVANDPHFIIAAGGGIVSEPETFELLLAYCFTVWIQARPEDHMRRVTEQGDLRPMRDNRQAMDDLRAILASRETLYARADARLDTSGKTAEESLAELASISAGYDASRS